ncbi:UNVERIFIED_CONTAM: hypothetical protein HDU68_005564 [Siphonaria sp. JEL0065]|nr:hypothetical protein HDU68_005564 [Siphonaria sp. JEL0065]
MLFGGLYKLFSFKSSAVSNKTTTDTKFGPLVSLATAVSVNPAVIQQSKRHSTKSTTASTSGERRVRHSLPPNKKDSSLSSESCIEQLHPASQAIKKSKRSSKTVAAEAIRKLAEMENEFFKGNDMDIDSHHNNDLKACHYGVM